MSNSLAQIPLFKSLDEATVKSFDARARWAKFEESELVIDYDDASNDVYFIVSGQVRVLYRTITGKEVILGEMGAGQFFGELSAIDGIGRSANVTALNRSHMCIMSGPVFMDLVTRTPVVCRQIMIILASRIRFLNTRLAEHSFLQTKHRLYAELIRLSQPRSGHQSQRVVSPPPFHHDLAARIGCRREAVSRELSALEKEGLVAKTRGALALLNPEELNAGTGPAMTGGWRVMKGSTHQSKRASWPGLSRPPTPGRAPTPGVCAPSGERRGRVDGRVMPGHDGGGGAARNLSITYVMAGLVPATHAGPCSDAWRLCLIRHGRVMPAHDGGGGRLVACQPPCRTAARRVRMRAERVSRIWR